MKSDNTKGKYLSVHLVTKIINRIMFPKTKELKMVWDSYQCKKQIPIGSFDHKNSQFNFRKPGKKMKMTVTFLTMQIIYWLVHLVTKTTDFMLPIMGNAYLLVHLVSKTNTSIFYVSMNRKLQKYSGNRFGRTSWKTVSKLIFHATGNFQDISRF
jgi:hypothetical protein